MEDFKKSFSKALEERMTSPLFGAFILSWLTCNWRIVYMLLFSGDDYTTLLKIGFVRTYLKDYNYSVWIPLISTILIVSAYPILTTGVFWLSEYFNNRKVKIRNRFADTQLLSLEASIELRRALYNKNKEFNEMLRDHVSKLNDSENERTKLNTELSEANVIISSIKEANNILTKKNGELTDELNKAKVYIQDLKSQNEKKERGFGLMMKS